MYKNDNSFGNYLQYQAGIQMSRMSDAFGIFAHRFKKLTFFKHIGNNDALLMMLEEEFKVWVSRLHKVCRYLYIVWSEKVFGHA